MELTFFEFLSRNLVCFVIAYNFNGKFAPEAGKARMRTAFFTRVAHGNMESICDGAASVMFSPSWITTKIIE